MTRFPQDDPDGVGGQSELGVDGFAAEGAGELLAAAGVALAPESLVLLPEVPALESELAAAVAVAPVSAEVAAAGFFEAPSRESVR